MKDKIRTMAPISARQRFLEVSPYDADEGEQIGRDPRDISKTEWAGVKRLTGIEAIRAKCLDCAQNQGEVRKCTAVDCPLWPFRMGSIPRGLREADLRGRPVKTENGDVPE